MKKGPRIFGRKNQNLYDTTVKMKDMDNVELVLDSPAILESGTASVRARPTVKHQYSSSDSFQGFAVPTPKVPLLPPSGPKANGSVGGDTLSNGSVMSVPGLREEDIFVPPPPSMAPPPPPFIPPPPDFMGDLSSLEPQIPQPPSTVAPKAPSLAPSLKEEDLSILKPPPMVPPKPPSTTSAGSASTISISSPPSASVPEHPKFAPPQPPSEKTHKTSKTPPPKPIRLSSVSNLDSPPQTPAPPPPVQTPTLSTFNPQNKAKLYNVTNTSVLSGYENRDTRPKQMLLLEDSGPDYSTPVLVQVDGKTTEVATPSKDTQELKENLQIKQLSQSEPNKEAKTGIVPEQPEITKPPQSLPQKSPLIQRPNSPQIKSETSKDKVEGSPSQGYKFSPLLDRKLRNLKTSETSGPREAPAASPLALLMAAKEREKQRSMYTLSRENSAKKNEPSASIQPSDSSPNSFVVTPRSSSFSSQEWTQETPNSSNPMQHPQTVHTPEKSSSPLLIRDQISSTSPALHRTTPAALPSVTSVVEKKQNAEQSPPKTKSPQPDNNKEVVSMPLLPPPPEFGDLEAIVGPPPSMRPPDPPAKKAPPPPVSLPPPAPVPSPLPKPKPPAAPKLTPPNIDVKPKPKAEGPTKPRVVPTQTPTPLSPSQATLLSILQKKMLEMDHKIGPVKEAESSSEDWGSPLSDENNAPDLPRSTTPSKNFPVVNKSATLDMRELENKVSKKYQETSSVKAPSSNGPSRHQYGMTFTVRPGTKQPITLVSKGET